MNIQKAARHPHRYALPTRGAAWQAVQILLAGGGGQFQHKPPVNMTAVPSGNNEIVDVAVPSTRWIRLSIV